VKFFGRDRIDKNHYSMWIVATLGVIVAIWIVAGLGLLSTIAIISSAFIPSTLIGVVSLPIYVGLFTLLAGAFLAMLFMIHRARKAELRDWEAGFAGFAWIEEAMAPGRG
jgi:hypothetical protein